MDVFLYCGKLTEAPVEVASVLYSPNTSRLVDALEARGLFDRQSVKIAPVAGQSAVLPIDSSASAFRKLIFIGCDNYYIEYSDVWEFAYESVMVCARELPAAYSLGMIVHGPGYGLDMDESFACIVGGVRHAIKKLDGASAIRQVVIAEANRSRYARMESLFDFAQTHRDGLVRLSPGSMGPGSVSNEGHIFVAMPFHEKLVDTYDLGIYAAVKEVGRVCERADKAVYTGEVMKWVRDKIEKCDLVIAEVSEPNPNVYLEIGYAWALGKKVLLVATDVGNLAFDIKSHRCIKYNRIGELKEVLPGEIRAALASP